MLEIAILNFVYSDQITSMDYNQLKWMMEIDWEFGTVTTKQPTLFQKIFSRKDKDESKGLLKLHNKDNSKRDVRLPAHMGDSRSHKCEGCGL